MRALPRVAVHKFSSCDGCQLALLNLGENLLNLSAEVEWGHFIEAGIVNPDAKVDIAIVEGSISTPHELERISAVRANSDYVISLGACATSGGIQALRNMADKDAWMADIYAQPEYIATLDTASPIAEHIKVDLALWGCPVSSEQLLAVLTSLLLGAAPHVADNKVCQECKRKQQVCTLVTLGKPCLGPVTKGGCGAICPAFARDCYGCFGPAESANSEALANRLQGLGLNNKQVSHRFHFINSAADNFHQIGKKWRDKDE